MAKTIIILGTGASLRFCDFKADEIWGVNGTYTTPNAMPEQHRDKFWMTKLFMTDTLFSHEQGSLNFDIIGLNAFAEKTKCEIISLNKIKLGKHILKTKPYPYNKIVRYFRSDYFTDTICYMIAYCLYTHSYLAQSPHGVIRPELKEPLKIKFFGIDMSTTREYSQSKGGVEYWLGVGYGMGIEFENVQGSTILMHPLGVPYGKWDLMKKNVKKNAPSVDPAGVMAGKNLTEKEQEKFWKEHDGKQTNRDTNT